ncbi:MAG: hypothetical protein PHP46_06595, partial [Candidatus Omnitrophica bacterium]|nr:hypothetical protein [Candidatus Omnitrophota bacterium]
MEEKIIITPSNNSQTPSKNFAALGEDYASFKKAKVAIVQAPYEKTTTYIKGTKSGPAAIIEASENIE